MKFSSLFLTIAIAAACFSVQAGQTIQHKLARVVLDADSVSYVVIQRGNDVEIITYDYQKPADTCKFLIGKGVTVKTVQNYATMENGSIVSTVRSC